MNKKLLKKIIAASIGCSLIVPVGVGLAQQSKQVQAFDFFDFDDWFDPEDRFEARYGYDYDDYIEMKYGYDDDYYERYYGYDDDYYERYYGYDDDYYDFDDYYDWWD